MAKKSRKNLIESIIGIPGAILKFSFEARDELKKVTWPDRNTTTNYTVAVIIACLVVGGITGGFDYLLSLVIQLVI